MTDIWEQALYRSSYGGVEFDCLTTSDSIDRAVVMHSYPRRDGGNGQDMGAGPRETDCRAIFWERPALPGDKPLSSQNHLRRFQEFFKVTQSGRPQEFVHPVTGSYRARAIGVGWETVGDLRNVILCDVTFVEEGTEPAPFALRAPLAAGRAAVSVQGSLLDRALADIGKATDVVNDALIAVERWESDLTVSVREVNLEVASFNDRIDRQIRILGLESDPAGHGAWKAFQLFNFQIALAAEAFRQQQPQLIEIELRANLPLRVVVTEHYGATDADQRYAEVMRLNDIEDPSSILAGTILLIPSPAGARQATLRRAA